VAPGEQGEAAAPPDVPNRDRESEPIHRAGWAMAWLNGSGPERGLQDIGAVIGLLWPAPVISKEIVMRGRRIPGGVLAVLAAVWIVGCDSSTEPEDEVRNDDELTFVRFADDAVPLLVRQASFWAKKGEDRELVMRYADGEDFLEFEVDDDSLERYPDGRLFQRGDSVLITVTVDPANRFLFTFEPAGLKFRNSEPAELEINFRRRNGDLNGDGVVDARDEALLRDLRVWQQERPQTPWAPLGILRFELDDDEIEVEVGSFTGFALAL